MKKQQGKLKAWFEWFKRWVSNFIHRVDLPLLEPEIVVDEIVSTDRLARAKSVIRESPGAVSTWYIEHIKYPNIKVIVTLDNLFELQTFTEVVFFSSDSAVNAKRTHKISVTWVLILGEKNKEIIKQKGSWIADLQGSSGSINAKAIDIVKYTVHELVNVKPTVTSNWLKRVDEFDWQDTIVSKAKLISSKHECYIYKIDQKEYK